MAPKIRFDNMDAAENAFFARQLEHIRPGVFEVQYAELLGLQLVPLNTSVHPGAEVFTFRTYDAVGSAEWATDMSKTSPTANVSGKETTVNIRSMKNSYQYNIQEARAAMMAGLDLDPRKARAARLAVAQKLDDALLIGDGTATHGYCTGLFKLSGTHTYTVPNGASALKTFADKTPEEINIDLQGIANGIVSNSLDVEKPDTLIVPLTTLQYISTRRMGDGSDATILQFFLKGSPYIKSVVASTKLETAGASSTRRMVAYKKDPDKLEAIVPVMFEQLPPQFDGYEVVTHCHARTAGVVVYNPKSISYADGV